MSEPGFSATMNKPEIAARSDGSTGRPKINEQQNLLICQAITDVLKQGFSSKQVTDLRILLVREFQALNSVTF